MRSSAIAGITILFALGAAAQSPTEAVDLQKEPHHTLLLENSEARVFRLVLGPHEETLVHRHAAFYAMISLDDAAIQNDVPGRKPILSTFAAGDVHTSDGGFALSERNASSKPVTLIVVERVGSPSAPFASLLADFKVHDTALGQLFEESSMRAYSLRMAAGGRSEDHDEPWDRLLVAVTDARLQDRLGDDSKQEIDLKAGEVHWIPKNTDRWMKNIGTGAFSLVTIELN